MVSTLNCTKSDLETYNLIIDMKRISKIKAFDPKHYSINGILIITAAISLILSLSQILSDSVINSDGILYLSVASQIQDAGWQSATRLYNWLFYPYLIAQFSTLTSLSLEYSAYAINSFFSAITCTTFILITNAFGAKDKLTLWFASLIILCYPNLNEYRNLIIRDHGYWAFYLLSCYFFIKTYKQVCLKSFIAFIASASLATLFRVEGLIFLLALPIVIGFKQLSKQKSQKLLFVTCTFIFLVLITLMFSTALNISDIPGLSKTTQVMHSFEASLNKTGIFIELTRGYLTKLSPQGFSEDYAPAVLGITFFLILLVEIFSTTSPLYALIIIAGFIKKATFSNNSVFRLWSYLVLLNTIILCGFLVSRYFLAGRYPIALSLTLMLTLPFISQHIYHNFQENRFNPVQIKAMKLIVILFALLSADGLVSTGASKNYLKEAGQWLAFTQQKYSYTVYTNNQFISFYADLKNKKRIKEPSTDALLHKIKKGQLKEFDLLAIQINRKNTEEKFTLFDSFKTQPLKTFNNKKGDSVFIFRQ